MAENPDEAQTAAEDDGNNDHEEGEQGNDDEIPAQDDQNAENDADGNDYANDDDEEVDFAEVARVLTVTARRLQGLTLGRKFSGPAKSIQQRKAESHCAVCGQRGHWQGDKECS